jgi:predicted RNase H-like HicB family nuclease
MQYQVFVQKPSDRHFVASIVGVPNVMAEGATKIEAIERAKAILEKQLADGEFVTIEVSSQPLFTHPDERMRHAGILADDPTFDDWMDKLAAIRQEANAMED